MKLSRRNFLKVAGAAAGVGVLGAGLTGCGSSGEKKEEGTASDGEFDLNDWDSVVAAAQGQTVQAQFMTSAAITEWLNSDVAAALKEQGIDWNLTVAANTVDVANLISSEMSAGKTTDGSVDLCWINGENFFNLKEAGYLYGPFLESLPSYKSFCDPDDKNNYYDCGNAIEGYEAPFQAVWDVFWADTNVIPESEFPKSADEFMAVCKKYPGKFTYPSLGNYMGTYFVDTMINAVCGKEVWDRISSEKIEKEEMKELIQPAIDYLLELSPYLWNKGASYPADNDQMVQLLADGEIAMLFNTSMPQSYIDTNTISDKVRPFFLNEGLIHDFWYLGIPANAAHPAASLVAVNEIMKPYIQVSQFNAIGYYPFTPYEMMDEQGKEAYDQIEWTPGLIPPTEMQDYAIFQANGQNNDTIEQIWMEEVNGK